MKALVGIFAMKGTLLFHLLFGPMIVFGQISNFTPTTAAKYLSLKPPVNVELAAFYTDGGSIAVTLVDAVTNRFHMLEDHDMRNWMHDYPDPAFASNTSGRIYLSNEKPERSGRLTSVEEGKAIKKAVQCLADAWLDREFTKDEQKNLQVQHSQTHDDRILRRYWNALTIIYKMKDESQSAAGALRQRKDEAQK